MSLDDRKKMVQNETPHSTNSGAVNTDHDEMRALVDWVQGTLKTSQNVWDVIKIMGLNPEDFTEIPTGYRSWKKQLRLGSMQLYYESTSEPGIHIILPGQACREFEVLSSLDWVELFRRFITDAFTFSRLDLAVDDFGVRTKRTDRKLKSHFSVGSLIKRAEQGLCRSKFEFARSIGKIKLDSGDYQGKTIYFGSEKSRIQVRIYEKHWERTNKGFKLEEGVEVWNRTEIQMRKERAKEAARLIAHGEKPVGEIVTGVIKNYVNFVDRDENDSNKARWKVSRFWNKFLGDVEKLRLTNVAPDKTIEKLVRWVGHQVQPSLSLIWMANDGKLDWLIQLLEDGVDRLKEKDIEMLERTKEAYQKSVEKREQAKRLEVLKGAKGKFSSDSNAVSFRSASEMEEDTKFLKKYVENKNARFALESASGDK
ncbi:replication initiation factor domain-containing protein [Brevibacillus daliensis]|uniref:replication initiation factor domain-containing protein n=1 Tax=Brevibacillus daliensis TaxID=2892995 RepID=UPI001E595FDC|nr:replication initiation factor domain-containing protein [Brevibacillus daliensis]